MYSHWARHLKHSVQSMSTLLHEALLHWTWLTSIISHLASLSQCLSSSAAFPLKCQRLKAKSGLVAVSKAWRSALARPESHITHSCFLEVHS